ncbi:hypothetical protein [Streptomyces sp. NPDC091215]|uniref:hypothetical protein n=1 Tax=Streptomyces sp. NPDC091215 TaxID=3155192 RepID=UPI0034336E3E
MSYSVGRVPAGLVEQLAPGGQLLAPLTPSPSWPGLAVVERTADERITAKVRAVEFARQAGHGLARIWLNEEFRRRIVDGPDTWTQRSMLAPNGAGGWRPTTFSEGWSATSAPSTW